MVYMENLMAVNELEKGREFANKLRGLIFQQYYDYDDKVKAQTTSCAAELAAKVLDSFTNTLSLFNHNNVSADSSISSSSFSHHFPSNSDESHDESPKTRISRTFSTIEDPTRSSPKKRKSIQTWVEDSKMSPKEDGHAWRKYGQKIILNTEHPRNYFRCTHKHDQGCEATKQVQKIQENPPLYRTTYFGHHTCTNLLNPLIFLDDSHEHLNSSSSYILSFDNNHNNNNNHITFDPKVNKNFNNFFLSFGYSLFPSSGSVKDEEQCHNIKKKKNNHINNNDKINNIVVPSSTSKDCHVSLHDQEAVLPPFGSGGDDKVDVFNSAPFYDPLVFEDLLLEMI